MKIRVLLVLVVVSMVSAGCTRRWSETNDFVSSFKCGMTIENITVIAKSFDGTEVVRHEPSNLRDVSVIHDGTHVNFWLDESSAIEAIQVSWIDRPMHRAVEEKIYLCWKRVTPSNGEEGQTFVYRLDRANLTAEVIHGEPIRCRSVASSGTRAASVG